MAIEGVTQCQPGFGIAWLFLDGAEQHSGCIAKLTVPSQGICGDQPAVGEVRTAKQRLACGDHCCAVRRDPLAGIMRRALPDLPGKASEAERE